MADVHVVMNAMNRMAARAMAQGHGEDPLLFALADYLQATLPATGPGWRELRLEMEALAARLALERELAGAQIEWQAPAAAPGFMAPRGLLLCAASALLQARAPRSGGRWRMALEIDGAGDVLIGLQGLSPGTGCNVDAALSQWAAALAGWDARAHCSVESEASGTRLRIALPPVHGA